MSLPTSTLLTPTKKEVRIKPKTAKSQKKMQRKEQSCTKSCCFFCTMNEPDPSLRKSSLIKCFKEIPLRDDRDDVLVLNGLWKIAMDQPNDPEFTSVGLLECMANLITRGIADKDWLSKDQNMYIPYYAAHVIGSYTMNKSSVVKKAVDSGVVPPLLELLRGKLTWLEQRVALRALVHISCHEIGFKALVSYEEEIVGCSMEIASSCFQAVYEGFVSERLEYHRDLLTRGVNRGKVFENQKAEEWASQMQCRSLSLLSSFVRKERGVGLICKNKRFLDDLCSMWGGLSNKNSPAGIGLARSLCSTESGRSRLSDSKQAVERLCNISRSSDDWRCMAIESMLLLLKDPSTRYKVIDHAVLYLKDLVELRNVKGGAKAVGEAIAQILLQDYGKIKYGQSGLKTKTAEKALEEVWELKVDRKKREGLMDEEQTKERIYSAREIKKEGNLLFWAGEIEGAVMKYSKALEVCPLKYRQERVVIHSNRAQCYLSLGESGLAISDATKAICLSSWINPHCKSLWRRAQAYDMQGLAKESLMDCLLFVNFYSKKKTQHSRGRKGNKTPYFVVGLIGRQIHATRTFASIKLSFQDHHESKKKKEWRSRRKLCKFGYGRTEKKIVHVAGEN